MQRLWHSPAAVTDIAAQLLHMLISYGMRHNAGGFAIIEENGEHGSVWGEIITQLTSVTPAPLLALFDVDNLAQQSSGA